ncbi:MAG TPA: amidohydrolase family protein [Caulobacteraceae bacterium]|nr:amidohydrolase family protein [Caulobacteraceae bacterium]
MDRSEEAVLDPDLPIVDPHHHLWHRPTSFLATQPPPKHPYDHVLRLTPRYLLDELMADITSGHNVRATVFVQCGAMYSKDAPDRLKPIGETEFVNGVAAMSASGLYGAARVCAGIVGHADLRLGDAVTEVLEAHIQAGGGRFRGIRHSGGHDPDPNVLGPAGRTPGGLYMTEDFRAGFARLAPLGLSFDTWIVEPQLPELIDLARAFADTAIVLDHVGTPVGVGAYAGKREERFPIWAENIRKLAKSENVFCKLGGLAMPFCGFASFMSEPAATSTQLAAEWKPYFETCIEAFGVERCMFESNFPVDLGSCSYRTLWNAFKVFAAGYSTDEKAHLFSGVATRAYRLALRPPA